MKIATKRPSPSINTVIDQLAIHHSMTGSSTFAISRMMLNSRMLVVLKMGPVYRLLHTMAISINTRRMMQDHRLPRPSKRIS